MLHVFYSINTRFWLGFRQRWWIRIASDSRKLLKEGGNLANLRVEKAQWHMMWALGVLFGVLDLVPTCRMLLKRNETGLCTTTVVYLTQVRGQRFTLRLECAEVARPVRVGFLQGLQRVRWSQHLPLISRHRPPRPDLRRDGVPGHRGPGVRLGHRAKVARCLRRRGHPDSCTEAATRETGPEKCRGRRGARNPRARAL